jgi:hypothetical protein
MDAREDNEAHRRERKAELARRFSGSIEISPSALYMMDLSGCPGYFCQTPQASEYPREGILGAV